MTKPSAQVALFMVLSLSVALPDGWAALFGFRGVNVALTTAWLAILLVAVSVLRRRAWPLLFGAPFALVLPLAALVLSRMGAECAAKAYFTGCF